MNKPFYMYMNVQGMGRNVFTCLITIFLLASCQSYKKVPYLQDVEVGNRQLNRKICMTPK